MTHTKEDITFEPFARPTWWQRNRQGVFIIVACFVAVAFADAVSTMLVTPGIEIER